MNEFVYARHFNNKNKKNNVNGYQMFQWKKNDLHKHEDDLQQTKTNCEIQPHVRKNFQ